ncbi:MAG: peptidase M28, partial [Cyclobacteriaceae bacterium]|nr:peptidase M28 [Cyclobacteriaceae bacterium]
MNKRFLLTSALALGISWGSFAQNPVQVKYANTITEADLEEYLTFLASDEMRGRDTGSPEGLIAANYLADFYKELGLTGPVDGGYFQQVPLVSAKFEKVSLKVGKANLVENEDFVFIGDGDMKKASKTELVFLGLANDENLAKVDVSEKLVGIWAVGERSNGLVAKVMDAGAAGVVIVSMEGKANFDRIANRYKTLSGRGRIGFEREIEQRPIFLVSSDK